MVDNFDIIEPILNWRSDDDFYFVQILQRKKDHKETKVNGTNNNARLVMAYYVKDLEALQCYRPEIIELCKVFNARAGINLNRRRFSKLTIPYQRLILDNIENGHQDKFYKLYSSIVGKVHHDNKKKWIVDVDKAELPFLSEIKLALNGCRPSIGSNKVIAEIPSKTGMHLITSPFDRGHFPTLLNDLMEPYQLKLKLDIQENNPTNLYIP